MSFIKFNFNLNHCYNFGKSNQFMPLQPPAFFNFNINLDHYNSPFFFGINNFIPYKNFKLHTPPVFVQEINNSCFFRSNNLLFQDFSNNNKPFTQNLNNFDFYTQPSWNNISTPQMDTFTYTKPTFIKNTSQTTEKTTKNKVEQSKTVDTIEYTSKSDIHVSSNKNYLENLSPEMQEKTKKLIAYANQKGYDVEIISGYRTKERQKELQKQYKNQPGRVAKNSAHCAGKAIDIRVTKNGKETETGYKLLGEYGKNELDMRWGGDFKSFRERWHFDYDWA